MRTAFFDALRELATADDRIVLMVGDLGFGVVTEFMAQLPRQFVNAGVAEQNMTGMAAGMAMTGKIVFTYSIANFPVLRCLEQIRNDICYHGANVRVVAVGGGMAYGALGVSHHATEDLAIMRAIPNMLVVAPGDPIETRLATRALIEHQGPAYLRLGRAGEPHVHATEPTFALGRAISVRPGNDLTLISTGGLLHDSVKASDILRERNVDVRVLSMHTVKPLDTEAVLAAARETGGIITVEEHSVVGGLGSAVAEVLAEADLPPRVFRRLGLRDTLFSPVGDQDFLRAHHGIDLEGILRVVGTLTPHAVA